MNEIISPMINDEDILKFNNGIHYTIYEKLGAHLCSIDGESGTYFAVWAPNALSVSVVGDFNDWNTDAHPMSFIKEAGVYELFIPHITEGMLYKFAIKKQNGSICYKADPYGNYAEVRPCTASVVADLNNFKWEDYDFIQNRSNLQVTNVPINIYELYLGSFCKPQSGQEFVNYRTVAPEIIKYVKEMGYTHIQLMPITEHPYDGSWGYQTIGYYAPTSRYGSPQDFMFFINELHKAEIGVILDWVPAHFPKDDHGLAEFDGTCLYEHLDPKQGEQPLWGTKIFNYGRFQVSNYLIANALFWVEKYHIDGIHFGSVSSMLYLDYGKQDGEWIANMYGGNENLEAIEFIKHLNSVMKKRNPGVFTIAEETAAYPLVTTGLEDGGLGFDLKWNNGFTCDYLKYIKNNAYERKINYNDLLFSMVYAYSENFVLCFSHDDVVHSKANMIFKMPGNADEQFANLRLTYAYRMMHPGKKLTFMGQDIALLDSWNEQQCLNWKLLDYPAHKGIQLLCKNLNELYLEYDELYVKDNQPEGFEWLNALNNQEACVSFLRKGTKDNKSLVVVANFDSEAKVIRTGLPGSGTLTEILNTDDVMYGGQGYVNDTHINTEEIVWDARPYSIKLKMAPYSLTILRFEITD